MIKKLIFTSLLLLMSLSAVAERPDCSDVHPDAVPWYYDGDGDGYGDKLNYLCSVFQPVGYVSNHSDCDDSNPAITIAQTYYRDDDGDGYGSSFSASFCSQPAGYVSNNLDCDDSDPNILTSTSVWYEDQDNDGFGDPNSTVVGCSGPTGYVTNGLDDCPLISGTVNGCPASGSAENLNWITSITYDIGGGPTAKTKAYYDDLGKLIQSQAVDLKTGDTWASQALYDAQGRPALQTLSAPINDTGVFEHQPNFMKNTSGNTYTSSDFEINPENPSMVGSQANTLGWYYSESNTSEAYQDVTNYPFTRTIYSELNPGTVSKTIGGNKVDTDNNGSPDSWVQGFSYTVPAAQELYYVFGKGYFGTPDIIEQQEEVITKFHKSVSIDVHGEESVVFTDGEGKVLAAARSGGATKYEVVSVIGEQGYVDVHIPKGIVNADIQLLGNASDYTIYNLRTEQPVTPANMTGNNLYRIQYTGSATQGAPVSYINSDGSITTETDTKGIRYKVNYYDYTLNYYDQAGRLTKSTQPLGFDEGSLDLTQEVPSHAMVTSHKYNALGQLVETSSPDEGTAQFIYREDGQIRFSQNSKQAIANEFSYTNYDAYGRPVESGVYDGPKSFGTSIYKGNELTDLVKIKQEGNSISKTATEGWISGLSTVDMISGDGYIEVEFPLEGERAMFGLSPTAGNEGYASIAYALYVINGSLSVYESGVAIASLGAYNPTDVLRVERVGSTVYYKKNGATVYTSSVASTGDLLGDFSLHEPDSKITNVTMGGSVFTPTLDPFIDKKNVTITGTTVTVNAGNDSSWDAGLGTLEVIEGDGSIAWEVLQTDKGIMVGLSSKLDVHATSYAYLDYAVYLTTSGTVYVYELGRGIGYFGNYSINDVFKVERIGNMIQYLQNGTVLYTSTIPSSNEALKGQASFRNLNGAIKDITIVGGSKTYRDYVKAISYGNTLQKTATYSWGAGFASAETIQGDGHVSFRSPKYNTLMVGLSTTNTNASYGSIDYALYLNRNRYIYIYESGVSKGLIGSYAPGDEFKVERIGGTVRYYKNDEVLYTSATSSSGNLLIDTSFHDAESHIEDLGLYDIVDANNTVSINDTLDPQYCKQVTKTLYDVDDITGLHAALNQATIPTANYPSQNFVAGNVSKTYTENPNTNTTWYSYDIYGRVEWLVQDIEGLGTKTIDYEYDPIKGLVTKVIYQKHVPGEMYVHRYTYNTIGELTEVATSLDNNNFTTQASYEYYETGALKRTVLGANVQGIDYVYNLGGQLKAINHPSLNSTNDPGGDTNDAFGMHIDYFSGDYSRTNTPKPITSSSQGANRFDGNIKATRWALSGKDTNPNTIHNAYTYTYNKNNWLEEAVYGTANNSGVITPNSAGDYKVSNLTYDANGNLLSLTRNKHTVSSNNQMDNFTYNYNNLTNQLNYVADSEGNVGAGDLDTQAADNYEYNSIGQLIRDHETHYTYNAAGLVTKVHYDPVYVFDPMNPPPPGNPDKIVEFTYNDRGQRITKTYVTYPGSLGEAQTTTTYYIRDVAGNVMAIYNEEISAGGDIGFGGGTLTASTVSLEEHPIYGASRIGIYNRQANINNYQVTDHLGNVRAVISSTATVTNYSDYYPFGMQMPDRSYQDAFGYRYAYQGQEKDPETGKEAFQLRLWDSRIGRWLTTDPYGQFHSPYLGMGNNPIRLIDPDGGFTGPGDPGLFFKMLFNKLFSWILPGTKQNFDYEGQFTEYQIDQLERADRANDEARRTFVKDAHESMEKYDFVGLSNGARFLTALNSEGSINQYYDGLNSYIGSDYNPWVDGAITGLNFFGAASGGAGKGTIPKSSFWSNGRIFYSGLHSKERALKFASSNGSKLVTDMWYGKAAQFISNMTRRRFDQQIWSTASWIYARGATGSVNTFINNPLRTGNIWQGIELPTLLRQGNHIIIH